jgi:hypothetical protein
MAKLSMPTEAAAALRASERMLLFCVASNTDWRHPALGVHSRYGLHTRAVTNS